MIELKRITPERRHGVDVDAVDEDEINSEWHGPILAVTAMPTALNST